MNEPKLQNLISFLEGALSPFHAVAQQCARLDAAGYERLSEAQVWTLEAGKGYYLTRNGSALIAFRLPKCSARRFMITASHSDSPVLKLKDAPEMPAVNGMKRLNTEVYGGALLAPWFDRPLGVAGRLVTRTARGMETHLVDCGRDVALIPSLAIHFDRQANNGHAIKPQAELLPVYGLEGAPDLLDLAAEAAGVARADILAHDLVLYNAEQPRVWGAKGEFLSAGKLDDLASVHASLEGFLAAGESGSIPVHAVFDNEEIGSSTMQGACAGFLRDTLSRIAAALGWTEQAYLAALSESFLLSSDGAHAAHPNHTECADPVTRARVGGGVALKFSGAQRYATDAVSAAVVRRAADLAGISVQTYVNHSDYPGGTTLGNLSVRQVAVRTADVGIPMLAMHSPYETCGVSDVEDLAALCRALYSAELTETAPGAYEIRMA